MPIKEGILLINKPRGISSFDVIRIIRKITNIKKIGHTGTLDPEAEGLLVVCVGRQATKHVSLFMKQDKKYLVEIVFGIKTSSGDRDGIIVEGQPYLRGQPPLGAAPLLKALKKFEGEILQTPPMFSAIHHNGKRLYEIARKGEKVEVKPRKIKINYIKLGDPDSGANQGHHKHHKYPRTDIEVSCSSGTYIRSLVEDIGSEMGGYAFVSKLVRLSSGRFDLKNSYNLNDLKENEIRDKIIGIQGVLNEIKDN